MMTVAGLLLLAAADPRLSAVDLACQTNWEGAADESQTPSQMRLSFMVSGSTIKRVQLKSDDEIGLGNRLLHWSGKVDQGVVHLDGRSDRAHSKGRMQLTPKSEGEYSLEFHTTWGPRYGGEGDITLIEGNGTGVCRPLPQENGQ